MIRVSFRLALLAGLVVLPWQSLPAGAAQPGSSATEAIPIAANGRFGATVPAQSSTWLRFAYLGHDQEATISVTFVPSESPLVDLFIYTGSADAPRAESSVAARDANTLTQTFSDPSARDVYVQIVNNHQDRVLGFVGRITPTSAIQGPPQGTTFPVVGPVAETPDVGLDIQPDGGLLGVLAPRQRLWYRFYHGGAGVTSTIDAAFVPSAGNARLDVYTGPDVGHLNEQLDAPTTTDTTISRQVSLASPQWVYLAVSNGGSAPVAYAGHLSPIFVVAPPPPTPTLEPAPTPTPTVQPAPSMAHDQRYFSETRFRVDDDAIWSYFQARGRLETFGFPVSRTFSFLGCPVQIFQRQIVQICPGRLPALLNVLDEEIFPYTVVNGSTFPSVDQRLKAATPKVDDADYGSTVLRFVRDNAPDSVEGRQVNFGRTFFGAITSAMAGTDDPNLLGLLALEVWGAPISEPRPDPNNADFVYQRFQRGIMHHIVSQGATRGILLADYVKELLRDQEVPADLRAQAQGSRLLAQYCPGAPGWLCRPAELSGTDLTFAFEPG